MNPLSLTFSAMPFAIAVALGLVVPLLMVMAYRNFSIGAGLLALAFGLGTALPGITRGGLDLGVRLDPTDIVVLMLMPVAFVRFAVLREARLSAVAFYVLVAVIAMNVAHGLLVYKAAAGAAARPEIYALTAAAYASTFPADRNIMRMLMRTLLLLGLWMAAVAVYRWIAVAFDIRELLPPSGSFQPRGHSIWRVIVSSEALLLAELAVAAWFFSRKGEPLRGWQWLAPILLLMVIVLQHRSTWVAALAGVVAALATAHSIGQAGKRGTGLLVALAVVVLATGLVIREGGLGRDVARSAADAVELRGTAGERLGSWRQLVQQWAGSSPRALLVGSPSGTSIERYTSDDIGARRIAYQAHNYYVTMLTSHGLIGFLALVGMLGPLLIGLYRIARLPEWHAQAGVLMVLTGAQAAYYLTYGTDYIQWLALGVALSMVNGVKRQHALAPAGPAVVVPPFRPRTWWAQ